MLRPQTKSKSAIRSFKENQNQRVKWYNPATKIIKQRENIIWRERDYIEIRRVAFDAYFHMFGLNFAIEKLRGDVGRESDVDVHLLKGLVPFEHLLVWIINHQITQNKWMLEAIQNPRSCRPPRFQQKKTTMLTSMVEAVALLRCQFLRHGLW